MYGRYGVDELYRPMWITALVLMLLACIPELQFLSVVGLVLLVWCSIRCYSKNIEKRKAERDAYLRFIGKIKGWCSLRKRMRKERKTHRYFKCPDCKKWLRVPKGKGKIQITCPHCHKEIIKKT